MTLACVAFAAAVAAGQHFSQRTPKSLLHFFQIYRKFQHWSHKTHNHFMALWTLSGTTRVSRYQKKHLPTHTYRGHQSSLICFLYLLYLS